ncbi:MAG: CpaF/VirB11 family protein [Acidimicrobiia bacterium]|nr:CpaF/VirB11 family protein [Acidimicrobiia bacterium]
MTPSPRQLGCDIQLPPSNIEFRDTGAGKTSLLNAMAARIATESRVITIEDAAELRLRHPTWCV